MKRKYGLVGYPLGHSFSRSFFQQKFEDEHINATYENFEIQDISCLRQLISDNHELCGLNVTIPHKTTVIPLLDELHPLAREIGAVNVIKITRQGDKIFLKGFNSDIIGFTNSIAPLLDDHMTKALILGTGGASKAIHAGLKALHITPTFVSRQKRGDILSYEDLSPDLIDNHKHTLHGTKPRTSLLRRYLQSRNDFISPKSSPTGLQNKKRNRNASFASTGGMEDLERIN